MNICVYTYMHAHAHSFACTHMRMLSHIHACGACTCTHSHAHYIHPVFSVSLVHCSVLWRRCPGIFNVEGPWDCAISALRLTNFWQSSLGHNFMQLTCVHLDVTDRVQVIPQASTVSTPVDWSTNHRHPLTVSWFLDNYFTKGSVVDLVCNHHLDFCKSISVWGCQCQLMACFLLSDWYRTPLKITPECCLVPPDNNDLLQTWG